MRLQPSDLNYPSGDDRFSRVPSEMTLEQLVAWTDAMPPAPEFNPAEQYAEFTQRQTAYAAYRNAIVNTRDKLRKAEGALIIPKAPVGDDIAALVSWNQATGITPAEFLTKVYRDSSQQMGHRITAAVKMIELIHRKMPQTIDNVNQTITPSIKSVDPMALASLTEKELSALEKLLDKMAVEK